MKIIMILAILKACLFLFASCSEKKESPSNAENEEKALAAINTFGKELKKELKKGLQKSPKEAVEICNVKAPEIANKVSSQGIEVGRVSLKNRNPENYPKEWMLDYIEKFHAKELKQGHVVTKLPNGKKGLLKPIATAPLCLNCHGTNIDPATQAEIDKRYPKDKAKGYKVGDIRGFFWAKWEEK